MSDYSELSRLADAIHGPGSTMQMLARWRAFENACHPKLIKELIAERDQLKAENERLRKERDARHPFKPSHEPSGYSDGCMVCGQWGGHFGLPCPKTRATAQADLPETRSGQIGAPIGKGEQS